jgi:plasmid stabilization system protein ParE
MKMVWLPAAQADLRNIYDYYQPLNPQAAVQMLARIHKSAGSLVDFPHLGKANATKSCRLLQVPGTVYVLPYRVLPDAIEILAVFDQRQERPDYLQ